MGWRSLSIRGALIVVSAFTIFSWPSNAKAFDVTVTATVVDESSTPPANPIVEFKGVAAPRGVVSIARNGVVIMTSATGDSAAFDIVIADQPVGQQIYDVTAVDIDGRSLTPMTFALNLNLGSTTIILGIFLGPSITIDKPEVKLGETVTVTGATLPNSTVTVTVNSVQVKNYSFLADANGRWQKDINTGDIGVGSHTAKAQATMSGTGVSEFSSSVAFAVNPLGQCDAKKSSDLNCDGRVNLTDFSILLFFWQQRNPANARADVNADSRVTIVDFSIMLFQWTG